MFGRSRSWVGGGHGKAARSIHSLDHLKYMYHVLTKNTTVTDHNRNLLVETIRSITEILIWGDQNDSSVFDFFLEKNMFVFFLNILRQKSGRYVCVQLLQTLNILFENISHETSLYYLLSNNYVNSIIVHKFDFSDEEIMAYYISFLKTLSLKLNNHTVHFFYNEHTNDFALYTEAIKFFNHPESMVRIAVRTITLNVYKVDNQPMLHYIRDKTAVPYFSNLVWFIGSHVIELDNCVQTDEEHRNRGKLSDLVAEHLDHLHYLNDILIINCEFLNDVLTDHLLNRLFLPLYVYSLVNQDKGGERPKISLQVSLYLLSQVFLIIHYAPLVNSLAEVILNGDLSVFSSKVEQDIQKNPAKSSIRCFIKPTETLERSLEINKQKGKKRVQKRPNYKNVGEEDEEERGSEDNQDDLDKTKGTEASSKGVRTSSENEEIEMVIMERCKLSELSISTVTEQNTTDEEKSAAASGSEITNWNRPFLDMVYNSLDCAEDDYYALFVLCLLYAMSHNKGIDPVKLERIQLPAQHAEERNSYNHVLAEGLIRIMNYAAQPDGKIRLATLELGCLLLKQLVFSKNGSIMKDVHLACLEGAREESVHLLRRFYKGEEIFLDMFEDEYRSMTIKPMNVEYLMMDASILLPPTGTPLTGIDFVKRLPCGDVERTRRAIRVFFMLRSLSLHLQDELETQLPLTREEDLIKADDVLDLNNSDLIACTVITKDGGQVQRFLAVDIYQMSLVEPDIARLGWGVVKFAGLLQDMQVTGVEDDSRALNITIHKPASSPHSKPFPILQATFVFSDHIRCIIAKQRLAKGRIQARRMKMQRIAALLDLPVQPSTEVMGFGHSSTAAQHLPFRFYDQSRRGSSDPTVQRSVFASVDKVPGFAVAQCINQHNPSPLSSPSPSSGSGSTGRCDSVTASSTSTPAAQSPSGLAGKDVGGCLVCRRLTVTVDTGFRSSSSSCNRNSRNINSDDASAPEQPQMTISGQMIISGQTMLTDETLSTVSKSSKNAVKNCDIETANLSPSLIPAQQPTISLITDDNTDALSVESLTLVPPVDPHSIRTFSCIPQSSLQSEVEVCKVEEVEEECPD
ncbi:protein CLEC16A isoform X4 [Apus apus]|uniref:protein CLEC16A isoform X4 n=1 Tax=Apus apus TaxID=8895 RepID=UPI0021F83C3B|nr:protein CLEC16A isoform X4 [Apus apus]